MPGGIFGCHTQGRGASPGVLWHLRCRKGLCLLWSYNQPVVGPNKSPPGGHLVPSVPLTRPQLPVQGSPVFFAKSSQLWPVPKVSAAGGVLFFSQHLEPQVHRGRGCWGVATVLP